MIGRSGTSRRAAGGTALLLLAALLVGSAAVVVLTAAQPTETVAAAPEVVVPAPSDRDVLRAAALGSRVSVQRDADGALVMVLPGSYDARTVEQVVPARPRYTSGSGVALVIGGLALLGASARGGSGQVLAAGGSAVVAAVGAVLLLTGSPSLLVPVLLAAALLSAGARALRAGRATPR